MIDLLIYYQETVMCAAICLNIDRLILGVVFLKVKPQLTRDCMGIDGCFHSRITLGELQKHCLINVVINQDNSTVGFADKL